MDAGPSPAPIASTLLPGQPCANGAALNHGGPINSFESLHKWIAFRYPTDSRKPSDTNWNSNGSPIDFGYPLAFRKHSEAVKASS